MSETFFCSLFEDFFSWHSSSVLGDIVNLSQDVKTNDVHDDIKVESGRGSFKDQAID